MQAKTINNNLLRLISIFLFYSLILTLVIPAMFLSETVSAHNEQNSYKQQPENFSGNIPVHFEENRGQFDSRVKFFARGTNGYSLFLTGTEAVYVLRGSSSEFRVQSSKFEKKETLNSEPETLNPAKATAVFMTLVRANENTISKGLEEMPHRTNYFKGTESNWRTEIPNFRQIRMENIYQGIDAVWKGKQDGAIQYDFVVEPNADPDRIEWEIEGAEDVSIDETGDLLIKTEYGTILQQKPFTFQEDETNGLRQEIESDFVIRSKTEDQRPKTKIGFEIGPYDRTKTLTIDPTVVLGNLSFSTLLGGGDNDGGSDIAIDRAGNVYVTGFTRSQSFPTTSGTFDTTQNGEADVFVTKFNASGSNLIYSTFLGGSDDDTGEGIAVDASGNAFITGYTFDGTTDYPTTAGAYDVTFNGTDDAFVTKLSATGSTLTYSTFLGGSSSDEGNGIAIDSAGNAYVTGVTLSTNFPTTIVAFDTTYNGGGDVFATKFNAAGSGIFYSTYIGGSSIDEGNAIAVDSVGNAFITGETFSTNFPTTGSAFDTSLNGFSDVFVTKLIASGASSLIYSTFIGGSSNDRGNAVTLDSSGNAFITGNTTDGTTDYPTTSGAFDTTHNGSTDALVTRLNSAGSNLVYSTLVGGSGGEVGNGIAIDPSGNAFIAGDTGSTNYPTSPEAFQGHHNGSSDAFVSKFGDYSISGRTLDTAGDPLANTAVSMSGNTSGFMLSDADGYFYFGNTSTFGGTHIVTAIQTLYNFTPPTYEATMNINKEINFTGRPTSSGPTASPADLGGQVRSTVGNVGLPNTKLNLIDVVSGQVLVTTSDANGDYEFGAVMTGIFYLVVPEREGYTFNPAIYEVNHFNDNLGLHFSASPNSPRPVNDFDGDGKTDLAVFRPENGVWYILNSQDNSVTARQFGVAGDVPAASDYDGDNRADIAVYRPAEGIWYRLDSTDGEFHAVYFGQAGDLPVQADFDGDDKTDLAVYRPSTGVWHRLLSGDGSYQAIKFGIETDIPVSADYDSDGRADLTVFRDGIWYRLRSSNGQIEGFQFGLPGDKPVRADFDSDGRMDTAVYRPSNGVWYWIGSMNGDFQARQFGISTDTPVAADYNGDGRFEQAVFRDGVWYVLRNDSSFYSAQFGQTADVPIP